MLKIPSQIIDEKGNILLLGHGGLGLVIHHHFVRCKLHSGFDCKGQIIRIRGKPKTRVLLSLSCAISHIFSALK